MRIVESGPNSGFGVSSVFNPQSSPVFCPNSSVFLPQSSHLSLRSSIIFLPPSSLFGLRSSFLSLPSSRPTACRLDSESGPLFARASIEYHTAADFLAPATVPAVADAPARKTASRRCTRRGLDGRGIK